MSRHRIAFRLNGEARTAEVEADRLLLAPRQRAFIEQRSLDEALANAIRDEIGTRVWSVPITSEKVFEALAGERG